MAELEKRITVKVTESLHRKVKVKAAIVGESISDILRVFLEKWVEEPPPESNNEE